MVTDWLFKLEIKMLRKYDIQTLKISPHHVKLYSRFNLPYLFLKTLFTLNNDHYILKQKSFSEAYE